MQTFGFSSILFMASLFVPAADAQEPTRIPEGEINPTLTDLGAGTPTLRKRSAFDQIWSLPKLYQNEDSKLIQELSLIGRYHGQAWGVASSQGDASNWNDRRLRAGARMRFLDDLTLVGNFNIILPRPSSDPTRGRDYVDVINLTWAPDDRTHWVIGNQKPGFTWEWDLSSNRLLTLERSLLVNQILPQKSTGILFEQKFDRLHYRLGAYSGRLLGKGLGDPFALAAVGYDLGDLGNIDKMGIQFYYLHNTAEKGETTKAYRNSFATSFDLTDGSNAFVSQLMFADGIGNQPDVWGFSLMPARFLIEDKLQLVARYQFANSGAMDGLQVQRRYERQAPNLINEGRGDRYHAGYLGLNWYLYGNRLKLMTGVEYSHMRGGDNGGDFDGWTGFAGIRIYF